MSYLRLAQRTTPYVSNYHQPFTNMKHIFPQYFPVLQPPTLETGYIFYKQQNVSNSTVEVVDQYGNLMTQTLATETPLFTQLINHTIEQIAQYSPRFGRYAETKYRSFTHRSR